MKNFQAMSEFLLHVQVAKKAWLLADINGGVALCQPK